MSEKLTICSVTPRAAGRGRSVLLSSSSVSGVRALRVLRLRLAMVTLQLLPGDVDVLDDLKVVNNCVGLYGVKRRRTIGGSSDIPRRPGRVWGAPGAESFF